MISTYRHLEYVHPEYVLSRDDISLQSVTTSSAVFTVTPNTDVYNPRVTPFFFIGQFLYTKELVVMPLESFHRLADEMNEQKDKIEPKKVFIANSARKRKNNNIF